MHNSKSLIILSILLISILHSYGQNIESIILKQKGPTCEEIAEVTSDFFAKHIASADLDSAKITLEYWKDKCGISEPIIRAKIILSILDEKPLEDLINDDFLWYVYNYINRESYDVEQRVTHHKTGPYFGYVTPNGYFDQVLTKQFAELSNSLKNGSEALLLSRFYGLKLPSIFEELQKKEYAKTQLSKLYYQEVKEVKSIRENHYGWITALWIPTGELKTLGSHPDIGFLGGWKKGKWNYDIILTFKFLKAKNEYQARRKSSNTIEKTDHFFGGQIGFEVGRDFYTKGPHEFQIVGGLAMDGIDVLEKDESQDLDAQSIISYNANIGLGYRFYTNSRFYLGFRAKYNIIDYTINNAIDLTGNAYTLQFIVGHVNDIFKSERLKELGQKIRK